MVVGGTLLVLGLAIAKCQRYRRTNSLRRALRSLLIIAIGFVLTTIAAYIFMRFVLPSSDAAATRSKEISMAACLVMTLCNIWNRNKLVTLMIISHSILLPND
jgi:DNA-binding LacI/PurR family transcriptional regulator